MPTSVALEPTSLKEANVSQKAESIDRSRYESGWSYQADQAASKWQQLEKKLSHLEQRLPEYQGEDSRANPYLDSTLHTIFLQKDLPLRTSTDGPFPTI
jgi:hypothetical protein